MLIAQGNCSYMKTMASSEDISKPLKDTDSSFDELLDALTLGAADNKSDEDEPTIGFILPVENPVIMNMQPDELAAYDVNVAQSTPLFNVESTGMAKGPDSNSLISQEYPLDSLALDGQDDAPESGKIDLSQNLIENPVPKEVVLPPIMLTNHTTQALNQEIDKANRLNQEASSSVLSLQSEVVVPTMSRMNNKIDEVNAISVDGEADDYRLELVPLDKEGLAIKEIIPGQNNQHGLIDIGNKGPFQSSTEGNLAGSSNQNPALSKGNPLGNYQPDLEPKFFVHSSGEKANLHIHQKIIGDITASIEMDHNKSSVTLITDNNEVKQLLQNQLSQLKTIFSESNLHLVQANVEDKSSQQGQGHQERQAQNKFENNTHSLDSSKPDHGLMPQQNTLIDTYV